MCSIVTICGLVAVLLMTTVSSKPYNQYTETISTSDLGKAEIRDGSGQYSLSYVTANGIQVKERSYLKLSSNGSYIPVREGRYSYISPDGIPIAYEYIADENGYQVKGNPLSTAPAPITP